MEDFLLRIRFTVLCPDTAMGQDDPYEVDETRLVRGKYPLNAHKKLIEHFTNKYNKDGEEIATVSIRVENLTIF